METGLTVAEHFIATKPIRIIEVLNPFRTQERTVTEIDPQPGESMGAVIARAGYDPAGFTCSLNGEIVTYDAIHATVLNSGHEIVLYPRIAGGSFGKQMMGLLILAAGAAIGMLTAGAGLFLFPALALAIAPATLFAVAGAIGGALLSWALSPGQPSAPAWSSTYDPTGPKGLAQPGTPIPKGYGTFGWCGNVVSSYVDFDGANAYINVLVCYGWGVAKSINNILINLQPLTNYVQCSYQSRLGTNTQPAIDGFDKTVNGFPQEIQMLVSNGPVTVEGTGTNIQGLDITTKLPSGLYRVTNDGNTVPLKVIYMIEVAPHGTSSWTKPLFAKNSATIKTTHLDGSVTYPAWVVVPTDRFAGSGIVYDTDNGSHTPGDPWTGTQTVTIVNLDSSTSSVSASFAGEWQPTDPNLNQALVTQWWEGYRVIDCTTLNAYFDTVSVYGLDAGQYDVRVTKIGYCQDDNDDVVFADATDNKHISDIWLWNINEIFWSNLCYPNMILVGVKALATSQMSGEDIQVMATIIHDIGADTPIPAALSGFEHDNPAIVALDVIMNPVYGMGVPASLIDVPAFVAYATRCDEAVTNQDGSTARRFIFAGVFDQSGDAWKTLQTIGNMSHANVFQIGMRYTVILDAPADPVQLFTVGNTKKDSFQETWLALDDRCNLIECDFADAARTYRMDLPVSVMTEDDINSVLQPKVTRTKLLGCTSRDQAWRWAYYTLLSTKLALRTIEFTAPIEAVCCSIGSVIAMQSDVVQWGVGGRVLAGSTTMALNVDRTDLTYAAASGWTVSVQHPLVQRGTATISSVAGLNVNMTGAIPTGRIVKAVGSDGKEYIVTGYGGSAILLSAASTLSAGQVVTLYDANVIDVIDATGVTVIPNVGARVSVASAFSAAPTQDSAWAYGQSAGAQPAKLFRVIGIKRSGDFNFDLSALEYNASAYTLPTPNYGVVVGVPGTVPVILNLTLTEQYQNGFLTGSTNTAVVAVGWQNSNTAVGAQVQVQAGNGKPVIIGNIQGQGCTFVGFIGTAYVVTVTGLDWNGNLFGAPATASITVEASTSAPANVTGFTGYADGTSTVLSWSAVTGADHYEIRYAVDPGTANFQTAAVLWDGTATTYTDSSAGNGIYMIVAVTSLATGAVQSVTPATYQNPPGSTQFSSSALIGPIITSTVGTTDGTTLEVGVIAQTVIAYDGTVVDIAAQTLLYTGLAASANYYIYQYIDASFNLQAIIAPPSTPDRTPSAAHSAASTIAGLYSWITVANTGTSGGTGGGLIGGGGNRGSQSIGTM